MQLEEERKARQQLFDDITDNKVPHHVPSYFHIGFESAILYGGYDLAKAQWSENMDAFYYSYKKVMDKVDADIVQFTGARPIKALTALGSTAFVMSNDGYIQHPEVHSMEPEEYDELIKDPYKFMVEVAAPRIYTQLDAKKHGKAKSDAAWVKGYAEFQAHRARIGGLMGRIASEYPTVGFGCGVSVAPMDHLSDVLRSFSGISKDVRRCPEKVADACEALLPYMTKRLLLGKPQKYRYADLPLHMAPFLNTKHFEKLWWPTFKKQMIAATEAGQSLSMFCESDFDRYHEYLNELPGRKVFRFEYGDPVSAKKICGDKHIVGGFYPAVMFSTAAKQECIDKAKELIDIMAPGGGFIFYLDKAVYTLNDEIIEKIGAVAETVREYGKY